MGLFSSNYYGSQAYPEGGGLIDRILQQLGQNQQMAPAGLPSDQAQYAPQQPAIAQMQPPMLRANQSSPLDTAQWPAGPSQAMAQMAPEQRAALPVSFRTPQDGAPQMQPLPPQLQQPGSGTGDHLMAGLNSFAGNLHTGLLGSILSGVNGLVTGQRNDPTGIEQQNLRTQYQALIAAGVPQNKALLATINPEFAKVIVPEALSNKQKYMKIGQDGLGREQYGFVDENNATVNGRPVSQQPQDNSGGGLGNMDLTGKEYLASIPLAQRGTVQGMVEGTIAPPSSFALAKPYWQNMIAAAKNYDPTFDATNWSGRLAGVKDFSAGKSSEMARAANQALHHTGAMLDSMDSLNNGDYPLINKVGNAVNEATGGGAPTSFRLNAHAVAEEMSKVFKGSNMSDTEIRAWEQNLSENMSPEQQRAAVGKLKDLLQGSLQALEEKRINSMGPMAAEKAGPLIKDEGQRVLQRIDDWIAKGQASSASGTGKAKTGVKWTVE
jgi:hypothetical protein